MGSDTVFTGTVHFPCSYLHFKGLSCRAYKCIMKRLVHIGFGHSNIVLETAGHWLIHIMNYTKHCIAVPYRINNYSYRKQIIYLVKGLILVYHLFIYTEEMFASSVNRSLDIRFAYFFFYFLNNTVNILFSFRLLFLYLIL